MSDPQSRTTGLIVEELAKIFDLLAVGRGYGVFVTAKPEVIGAIRQSGHRDAERIAANLCPVAADPWTAKT